MSAPSAEQGASTEPPRQNPRLALDLDSARVGAALGRFLNLAEGEGGRAFRLFALIFAISAAMVLLKAAQGGIFLGAYSRAMIPWAFAASALAVTPFSLLAVGAAARLGPARLAEWTLGAGALALLGLRLLLRGDLPGTPFVVYVVIEVVNALVLIQTWSVVSSAVDPRSAKRLLPIAGVGASVAWTLGGLLVSRLVARIGAAGLLLVAPLLFLLAAWLVRRASGQDRLESGSRGPTSSLLEGWRSGLAFVASVPLMRICLALSVLALVGEQLMDYQLLAMARERYRSPAAIAGFFGHFYGITSAISLVVQLSLSSRILARFGATQSLVVTPTVTVLFALLVLIVPGFAPIVLLRANDRVLKSALWSAAMEQTQTPLPAVRRAQARALSRGVVAPLAYAVAALGLALLPAQSDLRLLSGLTMVVVLGMVALVVLKLRRAYFDALRQAIDDRHLRLDEEQATTLDVQAAELIANDLNASDEGRALLAAELLVHAPAAVAERLLPAGLLHPVPAVRVAVLDGLGRIGAASLARVTVLLAREPSVEVRRAAVRCIAASTARPAAKESAFALGLSDADPQVRAACRVGTVIADDPGGVRRGARLVPFLRSGDAELVRAALDAIGPRTAKTAEVLVALRHCLLTSEPSLRLWALGAIVRIDARVLAVDAAMLLEDPLTTTQAVNQLVLWGDEPLSDAALHLVGAGDVLATVTGAHPGAAARAAALSVLLSHHEPMVASQALLALSRLVQSGRCRPLPAAAVQSTLAREVAQSYSYLSLLAGVARDDGLPDWELEPEFRFLGGEIELRFREVRQRVLLLLSLMTSRRLSSVVAVGLRRASSGSGAAGQLGAQVAELLEMSLPIDLAQKIVPLFDKLSLRERLLAAEQVELLDSAALADPLSFVMELSDSHLRVCALLCYGKRASSRFPKLQEEDAVLIPVFERMRFLRSVPLFAEIPGEELRAVAEIVDSLEKGAGEVVFRKGDSGDDMYVIVHGQVAIRDGGATIATLGEREFFGDLSVIDREARSADAVVLAPTELLRLRATDLEELLARRPQIREQILLVLVRRLRALNARLAH